MFGQTYAHADQNVCVRARVRERDCVWVWERERERVLHRTQSKLDLSEEIKVGCIFKHVDGRKKEKYICSFQSSILAWCYIHFIHQKSMFFRNQIFNEHLSRWSIFSWKTKNKISILKFKDKEEKGIFNGDLKLKYFERKSNYLSHEELSLFFWLW